MSAVLAHLSDIHLPLEALPSAGELISKRALSLLSWQLRRRHIHQHAPLAQVIADIRAHHPDALAIAGDLTNLGSRAEHAAAARWLTALDLPRAVIPGNHDMLVPMPWTSGAGLWAEQGGMADPAEPLCLRVGDVALIGVNSGTPTLPFFASGRIGRKQATRLEALLHDSRQAGLCRVVMIHHPPRPGMVVWRKALHDVGLFSAALQRAGAELVLHGHSHRGTFSTVAGTDVPMVGVTSASHRPGRLDTAAGWNRIAVGRTEDGSWRLQVDARRLGTDGHFHTPAARCYVRPAGPKV